MIHLRANYSRLWIVWYPSYSYYPHSTVSIVHLRFCANVIGTSNLSTSLLQKEITLMKNVTITGQQASTLAPALVHHLNTAGDEILLPTSGCQLLYQGGDTYLLKGYAWDNSDVDKELRRL